MAFLSVESHDLFQDLGKHLSSSVFDDFSQLKALSRKDDDAGGSLFRAVVKVVEKEFQRNVSSSPFSWEEGTIAESIRRQTRSHCSL